MKVKNFQTQRGSILMLFYVMMVIMMMVGFALFNRVIAQKAVMER